MENEEPRGDIGTEVLVHESESWVFWWWWWDAVTSFVNNININTTIPILSKL